MAYKCENSTITNRKNADGSVVPAISVCQVRIDEENKPILNYEKGIEDEYEQIDAFILDGGVITPHIAGLENVLTEKRFVLSRRRRIKNPSITTTPSAAPAPPATISWSAFTSGQWSAFTSDQWAGMIA